MTDAGSPATPETGPHAPGRDAEPHGGALSGATSTPATAAMMGSGADVGAHEEGRIGHPAPKPEPAPTAAPSGAAGPRQPPLLDRLPLWIVPAILLGVPLLVWGASQVAPGVYEDFVFPYYWGPIKADAHDFTYLCLGPDGEFGDRELGYRACEQAGGSIAQSGYNAINTATWAVLLLVSIAGAAQMLRRFSTPMGNRLIIGATLWTVAGSLWHALEDTRLIEPPLQYLFITPPIYLLFAAFGILAFLVGKYLEGVQAKAGPARALQKLWLLMAIAPMGSLLLWAREWDGVVRHLHPATVAALWAAAFLILRRRTERKGRLDAEDLVVVAALPVLAMSLVYIWMYTRDPWSPSRTGMPTAFVWAPLLAAAVTALVYLVARAFGQGKDRGAWLAYTNPVNLLIVFSQLVDGFATALGIDLHGYREKHVLSAKVIGFGREAWDRLGFSLAAENATFSTFVPVKLLVSLLVIYALDVKGRDDPDRNETVIGLAKFAIIMVGIGPGVRDFARLSLGV